MSSALQHLDWWSSLRHGGLLIDAPRLSELLKQHQINPLSHFDQDRLRRNLSAFLDDPEAQRSEFIKHMLVSVCGLDRSTGEWYRANEVSDRWSIRSLTGDAIRPSHLWLGVRDAVLPVFIDKEKRVGMGRGVRTVSNALQWMRKTGNRLGIVTNGYQWRILFAGLSYEAFAEWDQQQWLAAGEPTPELNGFRQLLNSYVLTPPTAGESCPFVEAINDSRKGQSELSEVLGERVRTAAELLVQGHTVALQSYVANGDFTPQELYRAAVRIIMRLVVILFSESREALLPRDNPVYFNSYSLSGLREQLERVHAGRLRNSYAAYPRLVSLFHLIYHGSSHEALTVRAYGGQLFASGKPDSTDGMIRALHALELSCYQHDVMNDQQVHQILNLLSRTKIRIRQGRQSTWVAAPVDFSSLGSEYIGILYEGLLDFELRQAGSGQPVIFLAVGNQPALPLATLEAMDDKALKNLLEKMKDTSFGGEDADDESEEKDPAEGEGDSEASSEDESAESQSQDEVDSANTEPEGNPTGESDEVDSESAGEPDERSTARSRAEAWAKRAIEVGKLVTKPRGSMTEEKKLRYAADIDRKARQIITKVILPGEWYLVRWGGTRKGSGTFYTKPQLAIPTVARTLQPLAYKAVVGDQGAIDGGQNTGSGATVGDSSPIQSADSISDIPGEYIESGKAAKRTDSSSREKGLEHQSPSNDWTPRPPEEILALKVCDPACGSGTFPLNALRYLTEALYESLLHYDRIKYYSDRTVIDLITVPITSQNPPFPDDEPPATYRTLAGELLPCRPDDNDFEARTKAVLRRYIVERCIYGVDLDPLAVELCRLSLWIETLDPRLPFTFLDHKIKCGNSLMGTWFDQFMHYPAMAWMREGGDSSHSNGVHFAKAAFGEQISAKLPLVKKQIAEYVEQQEYFNTGEDLDSVQTLHDEAERELRRIHNMGVHEAEERSKAYMNLVESQKFLDARLSLDLWCAIWVWPSQDIDECPLPHEFYAGEISSKAREIMTALSVKHKFFHWQLEFPDVFHETDDGFDAVLGNPPWDIAKPNSKEFFSAIDPLYRTYGKQEATKHQTGYFHDREIETNWLNYNASFRSMSNWLKYSGSPYGNKVYTDLKGKQTQDLNIGGGGKNGFQRSIALHEKWKDNREGMSGYSQSLEDERGFHHQGGGDINLYKMFLEQAHAILRQGGRLGFIVPSGLYSDHGTGNLRTLFLDHCRWQWLFGFENREGIFDIHRSFKFNPVIIEKGGTTDVIQTAFMRRDMADWEHAEKYVTQYPRERVLQFSPRSKAILEIQSQRDLEVLEKIYSNSVLLGDDGPNGWGIKYATEFHMTNDSKLFPPRDKWEEKGYRPDEYSRWLKGNWQPRTPDSPAPPGCKRVDIPPGIILSRDGQSWISEDQIDIDEFADKKGEKHSGPAIAIPLYQGAMLRLLTANHQRYRGGAGNSVQWEQVDPSKEGDLYYSSQFLIPMLFAYSIAPSSKSPRYLLRNIARTTDTRTIIGSPCPAFPAGHSLAAIGLQSGNSPSLQIWKLAAALSSLSFDWQFRQRLGGTNVSFAFLAEAAVPPNAKAGEYLALEVMSLSNCSWVDAVSWCVLSHRVSLEARSMYKLWALSDHERVRRQVVLDAVIAYLSGLDSDALSHVLSECDYPSESYQNRACNPKGMWRVDKGRPPELRRTVLAQVAFEDLRKIVKAARDVTTGIAEFLYINNGEGWQLPETLRLADYRLGHDDRAKEHQPVRECFGPRFYDWQLEQDPEESWRECHLHARNLLGPTAYQALLDELNGGQGSAGSGQSADGKQSVRESSSTYTSNHSATNPGSTDPDPNDFQLSSD